MVHIPIPLPAETAFESIPPPPPPNDHHSKTCESEQQWHYQPSDFAGATPISNSCPQRAAAAAAAVKLQKVYKSFRTRRKLADSAVLVEQAWWKILDFMQLKHSSISFFDIDKHETAISRWSRARTRAAKLGKGLSKNCRAQKLALQHWLEAIDPRHRYGHNLHFYYKTWLSSQSKEPFFYWLDIGEGKEVNLINKCPRSKLQQQCIKYLGRMERKAYEVVVKNGKLLYKKSGELLDTPTDPNGSKWIFVLSTSRNLYVAKKNKGSFQHSSFLAGGATLAAGRIIVHRGVLKVVCPHSGHYRPTPENFQDFITFLRDNHVDLTSVTLDPIDEEEEGSIRQKKSMHSHCNSSGDDFITGNDCVETEENNGMTQKSGRSHYLSKNLTALEIPSNENLLAKLLSENQRDKSRTNGFPQEASEEETILHRINAHKETKSYQLGRQLSCIWSKGAGPRIGCLRDYPTGLQSHALGKVNLSPTNAKLLRLSSPLISSSLYRSS